MAGQQVNASCTFGGMGDCGCPVTIFRVGIYKPCCRDDGTDDSDCCVDLGCPQCTVDCVVGYPDAIKPCIVIGSTCTGQCVYVMT